MRDLIQQFRSSYTVQIIALILLTEFLLVMSVFVIQRSWFDGQTTKPLLDFDPAVNLSLFVSAPLFIITIAQIRRAVFVQKSAFVKDFMSKIYTDELLRDTYHNLIYTYDNEKFQQIHKIALDHYPDMLDVADKLSVNNQPKPIFDKWENINYGFGRISGSRFYHPALFQGSEEERRLDVFLNYMNIIGYHFHQGLVRIDDVYGNIGQHLMVLNNRDAFRVYLYITRQIWERRRLPGNPPFAYLEHLLACHSAFHQKQSEQTTGLKRVCAPDINTQR